MKKKAAKKPAKKHARKHNPAPHHYAAAPKKRHSRRRRHNPGGPFMDAISVAGVAAASMVLWDIVGGQLDKVETFQKNPMARKGLQAALGLGAAYLLRARPTLALGIAAGTAGATVARAVEAYIPVPMAAIEGAAGGAYPFVLPQGFAPSVPVLAAVSSDLGAIQMGDAATQYQIDQYDPAELAAELMRADG